MILFKKIVHGNCIKIVRLHIYNKYTIVSKNKFILDIRSFYDSLIVFLGLILQNKRYGCRTGHDDMKSFLS